jgi:uroporphyrin-III C-methyltransferase/precorrin-2 dehydrogenase/sirohydrochlorin ferrochelatase
MVFGRAAEEIEACRAAGIPVEVVPGITAALGAAAELQIPLTGRSVARRLQLVSGHDVSGEAPDHDWRALVDTATTTAFYMSGRTFAAMLPKLVGAGLDADAPALAIVAATTPRSRHIRCPVHQLPAALASLPRSEPCLVMIGRSIADIVAASIHARAQEA